MALCARALVLSAAVSLGGCFFEPDRQVGNLPPNTGVTGSPNGGHGDPCATNQQCSNGTVCVSGVCVGQGQLRVSMHFDGVDSDFDIHMRPPGLAEVFFAQPRQGSFWLDHDECVHPCGNGKHIENIFTDAAPLHGNYEIFTVNYDGRSTGPYWLEVVGVAAGPFQGTLPPVRGYKGQSFFFQVP
jgi:hypothetical protein